MRTAVRVPVPEEGDSVMPMDKLAPRLAGYLRDMNYSDALCYGGSGQGNLGGVEAAPDKFAVSNSVVCIIIP